MRIGMHKLEVNDSSGTVTLLNNKTMLSHNYRLEFLMHGERKYFLKKLRY